MFFTTPSTRTASCSRSAPDWVPTDFDATTNPIIARHWFGVEPFRPIGHVVAYVISDLRRRRHVQMLHRLGPRALNELLVEIGAECSITTTIKQNVETYAALDPETVRLAGGDRFPAAPIHAVRP